MLLGASESQTPLLNFEEKNLVTLADVAQKAGVSSATASRALQESPNVRPVVANRVRAAARSLGYVPHGAARALVTKRTHAIGAIIPNLQNPVFAECIEALQQTVRSYGYSLLLANSMYDLDLEQSDAEKLIERGVDGLVLLGSEHHKSLFQTLKTHKIPYVNTWTWLTRSKHPCVGFDNFEAASMLTKYLIDIGHREFSVISSVNAYGSVFNDRTVMRLEGIKRKLGEHGITLAPDRQLSRPYSIGAGREALRHLMQSPNPPTAVMCGNDVLAFGAVFEANALGYKVPGDISICGFDDIELARQSIPPLTTVSVPAAEIGRLAGEYLIGRIMGSKAPPAGVQVDVKLIVRGSTAPPRRSPRNDLDRDEGEGLDGGLLQ